MSEENAEGATPVGADTEAEPAPAAAEATTEPAAVAPSTETAPVAAAPAEPAAVSGEAAELAAIPPPPPPDGGAQPTSKTAEERRSSLANALQTQVAQGARIESQSDYQAVIVTGHRVNHLLHFIIGVITLGLWWIVWLFIAIFGGEKRRIVNVDEFGNVFVQKV